MTEKESERATAYGPAASADPRAQMRTIMGPMMVDKAVRQAIQHCWVMLPEEDRTAARVEQEIRRLVVRALQNLKEDSATFGFTLEDAVEPATTVADE